MERVVKICQELLAALPQAEEAREYLDSRLPPEAQQEFQFGYFPAHEDLHLLTDLIPAATLTKLGLLYYYFSYDQFEEEGIPIATLEQHNLIMPYKDLYGRTVALVGRSLLSEQERKTRNIPKYRNSSFPKSQHLFGLNKARDAIIQENTAMIVEGQFDCIKAHSLGIKNVVALGSSNMSFEQFCLIGRYCQNLILLLDNDEAGIEGNRRISANYGNRGLNIRKACVPDGFHDLFEYLDSETTGAEEFARFLRK